MGWSCLLSVAVHFQYNKNVFLCTFPVEKPFKHNLQVSCFKEFIQRQSRKSLQFRQFNCSLIKYYFKLQSGLLPPYFVLFISTHL